MYKYALKYEIVEKDYSAFLYIPKPEDDESGEPFTEEEMNILWKHQQHPVVEMLLIMCYSGFRIISYTDIKVDLKNGYFKGGVKTDNSKERIVPIHSAIYPMVSRRYNGSKNLLLASTSYFRTRMYKFGSDITNAIYGHRSLDDLRKEIEKIKAPWLVANLLLIISIFGTFLPTYSLL